MIGLKHRICSVIDALVGISLADGINVPAHRISRLQLHLV